MADHIRFFDIVRWKFVFGHVFELLRMCECGTRGLKYKIILTIYYLLL